MRTLTSFPSQIPSLRRKSKVSVLEAAVVEVARGVTEAVEAVEVTEAVEAVVPTSLVTQEREKDRSYPLLEHTTRRQRSTTTSSPDLVLAFG